MVVLKIVSACCTPGALASCCLRICTHVRTCRDFLKPHQVDSLCRSALLWVTGGSEGGLHGLMHRLLAWPDHHSRLSATQRAPARVENDSLALEDTYIRHKASNQRKAALHGVTKGILYTAQTARLTQEVAQQGTAARSIQ